MIVHSHCAYSALTSIKPPSMYCAEIISFARLCNQPSFCVIYRMACFLVALLTLFSISTSPSDAFKDIARMLNQGDSAWYDVISMWRCHWRLVGNSQRMHAFTINGDAAGAVGTRWHQSGRVINPVGAPSRPPTMCSDAVNGPFIFTLGRQDNRLTLQRSEN